MRLVVSSQTVAPGASVGRVGEPVGGVGAELVRGAIDSDCCGAPVEVGVAWFNAVCGQFDSPIQLGLSDVARHRSEGRSGGGGEVDGVGVVDDDEFAPRHGLGGVPAMRVLEVDET
jgi:hypothetical protein